MAKNSYESNTDVSDDSDEELLRDKVDDGRIDISADAWGKKKIAFYGGQADKDFGGWNEEEDEDLELEEEDAISRQKNIDASVDNFDFAALLGSDDDSDEPKEKLSKIVAKDIKTKSKTLDHFFKHSPTLDSLVSEYNRRFELFKTQKPILEGILQAVKVVGENDFIKKLKLVFAAYNQYMNSLMFFFYLKDSTPADKFKATENHPVLDDIMELHPILMKVDAFLKRNMTKLQGIYEKLQKNPEYANKVSSDLAEPPKKKIRKNVPVYDDEVSDYTVPEKKVNGVTYKNHIQDSEDEFEKRKITHEMQKNRGLTVNRKKDLSHSRVKKRVQYKKALHKHRSQIPDVRHEDKKYDGEKRGIRSTTVRSIKLKA